MIMDSDGPKDCPSTDCDRLQPGCCSRRRRCVSTGLTGRISPSGAGGSASSGSTSPSLPSVHAPGDRARTSYITPSSCLGLPLVSAAGRCRLPVAAPHIRFPIAQSGDRSGRALPSSSPAAADQSSPRSRQYLGCQLQVPMPLLRRQQQPQPFATDPVRGLPQHD